MTDLRQAAQQALEFLMTRRLGAEAVIESLNEALAREHAMHELARLGQEIEQGQAEQCIGKDPRCPCQDGDACHYKDCGNTKARPAAQPEPTCPKCKAAVLYECVACSSNNYPPAAQRKWQGLTDEDVNRESAMIALKMKLAFHAGMYVAQQILKERNT